MKLAVRSVADAVHEEVRDRILSGELAGGEPIRQDALAQAFGISKIPLREALTRLERDGLVVSEPNRGFFVSSATAAEAEEVFALRLLVEPSLIVAGSLRATGADHDAASRAVPAVGDALSDPGVSNRLFHLALARPGSGRLTRLLLERLLIVSDRYVRLHLGPSERHRRADEEHRAILAAWIAADEPRLDRLVRDHLRATLADLRAELATFPAATS